MDFSVLVIAHQRAGHLQRLLDGARRNSVVPNEIIVVYMDDPSPQPVDSELPLRILHLQNAPGSQGLPLAQARNFAARSAIYRNLIFLDVDCIPASETFSNLLRCLQAHEALSMVTPRYLRTQLPAGPTPPDAELVMLSTEHHMRADVETNVPCQRHELFWSLGFAITAQNFARLGGFSTDYNGYGGEDTDFAFKAREQELPVLFSQAAVFHQHHGVYKPPLNHFEEILINAETFRQRWGVWPMTGWLEKFAELGLIVWTPTSSTIRIRRRPSLAEVENSRCDAAY